MKRLSSFARAAPKLFYVLAVVDVLKNAIPFGEFFVNGTFRGMDYGGNIRLQLFAALLSVLVYAAQWVAYGVSATLLIAIYDEVALLRAPAGDAGDTLEAAE
jgi:hypothetical protein